MYRDHRTYVDFNGVERTEDFYFNLSKAEIADMELSTTGGIKDMVNKILEAKDQAKLVSLFKDLIRMAYGVKSEDGRNFIKNDKVREDYFSTNAYSDLYMELATNDKFASQFFEAILPVTATDSEPNTDNAKELPN